MSHLWLSDLKKNYCVRTQRPISFYATSVYERILDYFQVSLLFQQRSFPHVISKSPDCTFALDSTYHPINSIFCKNWSNLFPNEKRSKAELVKSSPRKIQIRLFATLQELYSQTNTTIPTRIQINTSQRHVRSTWSIKNKTENTGTCCFLIH